MHFITCLQTDYLCTSKSIYILLNQPSQLIRQYFYPSKIFRYIHRSSTKRHGPCVQYILKPSYNISPMAMVLNTGSKEPIKVNKNDTDMIILITMETKNYIATGTF